MKILCNYCVEKFTQTPRVFTGSPTCVCVCVCTHTYLYGLCVLTVFFYYLVLVVIVQYTLYWRLHTFNNTKHTHTHTRAIYKLLFYTIYLYGACEWRKMPEGLSFHVSYLLTMDNMLNFRLLESTFFPPSFSFSSFFF